MKISNKIINKGITGLLILSCLVFSSCVSNPVRLSDFTSKNPNQAFNRSNIDFSKGRTITAKSGGFQLLLFIPIAVNGRQERAFEDLRAKAGDSYITDIQIKESWTYAVVGTVYTTTVKATAYPYKN